MPYVLCIYLLEAKWHRQNAHANDGIGEGHHVARVCGAHFFYVVHVVTLPNNNLINIFYFHSSCQRAIGVCNICTGAANRGLNNDASAIVTHSILLAKQNNKYNRKNPAKTKPKIKQQNLRPTRYISSNAIWSSIQNKFMLSWTRKDFPFTHSD